MTTMGRNPIVGFAGVGIRATPDIGNPDTHKLAIPGIAGDSDPGIGDVGNPGVFGEFRLYGCTMERDTELRIKGHLYEITAVNDEVLESRQGFPASERGYEKTLTSVAGIAGQDLVDEVATHIKNYIQDREERPPNQTVRKKARILVSKAGHPPDEYLNAA